MLILLLVACVLLYSVLISMATAVGMLSIKTGQASLLEVFFFLFWW